MKSIFHILILISLIDSLFAWSAEAQTSLDPEVEKIKDEVSQHSRLPIRKIAVRLKNGAKLKGHPADVEDETFVLVEPETGGRTMINYIDVAKVNRIGLTDNEKKVLLIGAVVTG